MSVIGASRRDAIELTPGRHLTNDDRIHAAETLKKGGLLITPSDGGYALSAEARDKRAVAALRSALAMEDAPLSVAFSNFQMLADYASLGLRSGRLTHHLMPGALTLVMPLSEQGKRRLGTNLNRFGTIGARLPDNPVERELAAIVKGPVTTTAIRDDRGDLVTDPHDARAIVDAGLAGCGDADKVTVVSLMTTDTFRYATHSTVAEVLADGELLQVREGAIAWPEVCGSAGRPSRWEIEDWT